MTQFPLNKLQALTLATVLFSSVNCQAQQGNDATKAATTAEQGGTSTGKIASKSDASIASAKRVINSVIDRLSDRSIAKDALSVLDELIDDTRKAQSRIYVAVRTINRNLDSAKPSAADDISNARALTEALMGESYSDGLFQSGNLSDQITTRLANLVADSVLLQTDGSAHRWKDFLRELGIIRDRVSKSRKFRVGIGAEYLYLPTVTYATGTRIDLTAFQTSGLGGSAVNGNVVRFDGQSTPAIRLSASTPVADVWVSIPSQRHSQTFVSEVRRSAVTTTLASPDLLHRTSFTSNLKTEYDAAVSIDPLAIYRWATCGESSSKDSVPISFHVAYGATGFRVEELATTDVRVRNDPLKTYQELASSGTIATARRFAFSRNYIAIEGRFSISDESQVGIVYRDYLGRRSDNETSPWVSGGSLSLYFVWAPTFGW
jgi:hypothetical protein